MQNEKERSLVYTETDEAYSVFGCSDMLSAYDISSVLALFQLLKDRGIDFFQTTGDFSPASYL